MADIRDVGGEFIQVLEEVEGQFAVLVNGTPVPLLSLPPGVFAAIQDDTGVSWATMLRGPLDRFDIAERLVQACAVKAGRNPVEIEDTEALVRMFVRIGGDGLPDAPPLEGEGENPTNAS